MSLRRRVDHRNRVGLSMRDDNESIARFEPLMVGESSPQRAALNDLALELATSSAGFNSALPTGIARALAELIRSMNCYYSNLIEGHHSHPVDIERALQDDYSTDPVQRDLQREAKAHIAVQRWIDEGGIAAGEATSPDTIADLHSRFCQALPAEMLLVEDPRSSDKLALVPGAFRDRDVEVGRHLAISPGAVPRFLTRLHEAYSGSSRMGAILATACAHHRLLWVHPFLDGNGRVARLMSHAMLREALDTQGLWSVARGLARNEADYKQHLMACDGARRGDRDGRGALSEAALAEFVAFFLQLSIDQVSFMQGLMKPRELADRVSRWALDEIQAGRLPAKSDTVLRLLLAQGELARAEVPGLLGMNERSARRVTAALTASGAIKASSSRAPLALAMPAKLAHRWLPGLFPDVAA